MAHALRNQTEYRNRGHEQHKIVELGMISYIARNTRLYTNCISGVGALLYFRPRFNKESSQIWEVSLLISAPADYHGGFRVTIIKQGRWQRLIDLNMTTNPSDLVSGEQ